MSNTDILFYGKKLKAVPNSWLISYKLRVHNLKQENLTEGTRSYNPN